MIEAAGIPTGITSDNIRLSKVIQARSVNAVVSPLAPLSCSDPKILEYLQAATAASTRRAYHHGQLGSASYLKLAEAYEVLAQEEEKLSLRYPK